MGVSAGAGIDVKSSAWMDRNPCGILNTAGRERGQFECDTLRDGKEFAGKGGIHSWCIAEFGNTPVMGQVRVCQG